MYPTKKPVEPPPQVTNWVSDLPTFSKPDRLGVAYLVDLRTQGVLLLLHNHALIHLAAPRVN